MASLRDSSHASRRQIGVVVPVEVVEQRVRDDLPLDRVRKAQFAAGAIAEPVPRRLTVVRSGAGVRPIRSGAKWS